MTNTSYKIVTKIFLLIGGTVEEEFYFIEKLIINKNILLKYLFFSSLIFGLEAKKWEVKFLYLLFFIFWHVHKLNTIILKLKK